MREAVYKAATRLTESANRTSASHARNRRNAGAAPQNAGATPGDEIEPFDFHHARGVPVRISIKSTKDADERVLAAPIEFKFSTDKDTGTISGYGSVFGVRDLHADIVEAGAFAASIADHKAAKTAPAMLWGHDPDRPIGVWDSFSEDQYGLKVSGRLNLDTQDGKEALALLKQGAFNGLSIGYRVNPGGAAIDRGGVRRLKSVELWEVSLVTFPSNRSARVDGVKSMSTRREFEGFLRAAGFPKAASRKLAGGGWPALRSDKTGAGDLLQTIRKATHTKGS